MSGNTSEVVPPHSLKAKKLKVIKIGLVVVVVCIGLAVFTPAKKIFAKAEEDPRMKDNVFGAAVYFAEGFRDDPFCFRLARMIIDWANPSSGSVFYRETVYEKLTAQVPEACFAPSGDPPSQAVLQYVASTRPGVVSQDERATAPQKIVAPMPVVAIDPLVVNLQSDTGQWFLQVSITLKMTDAAGADLAAARSPEIRNRILMLLSDKRPDELATADSKQRLADDLVAKLNQPLSGGGSLNVAGLFFTSFVIQQQQ